MADSSEKEIAIDVFPYLKVYRDGTVERTAGTQVVPAGLDPQTGVESKDIMIIPKTGVSARLYRRSNVAKTDQNLPLVVYFHGGGFFISSTADPLYHNSLNLLVAEANIILISVNYRLAPEHPLPAAYEDSWAALEWIASQSSGDEEWLKGYVDFERVFLAGDSAGANISHHLALKFKDSVLTQKLKIIGIALIHPYFWGEVAIGSEVTDQVRKAMVDKWWGYVCPSEKGGDDVLINPFADGAPSVEGLACDKVIVIVAGTDILRDRGKLYFAKLISCEWIGKVEMMETEGEDHVFHIFNPNSEKAKNLIKQLASFINQ